MSLREGSISKWKGNLVEDLHRSISKLKQMVISILEEYLRISDPNVKENAIEINSNWFLCPICTDAWESGSLNPMVVCPKCEHAFHNPRSRNIKRARIIANNFMEKCQEKGVSLFFQKSMEICKSKDR